MSTDLALSARSDLPLSWEGPFEWRLESGLRILLVARARSPVVELRLVTEGGFATDPDSKSGLSALAIALFTEGLLRVDGAQVGFGFEALGASLCGQLTADAAVLGVSALSAEVREVLRVYVRILTHPEFTDADLELVRTQCLTRIADERLNAFELPLRVLPPMLYGRGHQYARPWTGSGLERELAAISAANLRRYYAKHLVPLRSVLLVAGPDNAATLRAQLEEAFGEWRTAGNAASSTPASTTDADAPSAIIIHRPGASQTTLAAGLRTIARNSGKAEALMVADTILGGIFTSRLNLSLRERRGWTYGVRSVLLDARLQGFWLIRTAVRKENAAQAVAEIVNEIENLAGRRPCSEQEFGRAIDYLVARIPASYETCAQIADALAQVVIYGLPTNYLQHLAECLSRLTPEEVTATCRQILAGGHRHWVIIGDAAELSTQLHAVVAGNIEVIDPKTAELR